MRNRVGGWTGAVLHRALIPAVALAGILALAGCYYGPYGYSGYYYGYPGYPGYAYAPPPVVGGVVVGGGYYRWR